MDYMGIKHIAIHSPTTSLQQGQPFKFFITASYKTKPDIKLQEGEKAVNRPSESIYRRSKN
jgi:hypothetical protein